jgi:hypothetical protein
MKARNLVLRCRSAILIVRASHPTTTMAQPEPNGIAVYCASSVGTQSAYAHAALCTSGRVSATYVMLTIGSAGQGDRRRGAAARLWRWEERADGRRIWCSGRRGWARDWRGAVRVRRRRWRGR